MPNPMNQATKRNEPHLRLANCFRTVTHSGISRVVCANIFVCRRRVKYYYLKSSWVHLEHAYCRRWDAICHKERGPGKRSYMCTCLNANKHMYMHTHALNFPEEIMHFVAIVIKKFMHHIFYLQTEILLLWL
jgi:hypothetical protein